MSCDPGACITAVAIGKLVAGAALAWISGYGIGIAVAWVDRLRGAV